MKQANQDRGTLLLALVAGLSINGTFAALFSSIVPFSVFPIISLVLTVYCLHQRYLNRTMPVGLPGTGILMVSTLGILFYGQHPDTAAIIGMVIIASGIIIMNLFSKMGSEEAEETPVTNLDKKIAN